MGFDQTVGANVRQLRQRHDLSQQGLCDELAACGLIAWSQPTVAAIEAGRRALALEEAIALAAFLKVDFADIIAPTAKGTVELPGIKTTASALRRFLTDGAFHAPGVVPKGRSIRRMNPWRARMEYEADVLDAEAKAFERDGGGADELRHMRERYFKGEIDYPAYAGWKSGQLKTLRAGKKKR